MKDVEIYSGIFDIVNQNMQDAGKSFHVSKPAFMFIVEDKPQSADIYEISKESDNSVFMEKCYIACLKRLADSRAWENWKDRFSLPKREFQKMLVSTIMNSQEYKNINVKVYNNIYSQRNIYSGNLTKVRPSMKINIMNELYAIYRKQPESIKKILRKVYHMVKR